MSRRFLFPVARGSSLDILFFFTSSFNSVVFDPPGRRTVTQAANIAAYRVPGFIVFVSRRFESNLETISELVIVFY